MKRALLAADNELAAKAKKPRLLSDMPINTLEIASEVWEEFNRTHRFYVPSNKKACPDTDVDLELRAKYSTPEELEKIIYIQRYLRKL